ncbi:2-C-methyl-D-erythritol 4-phosphate cytidylyltransferase [Sporichthya brevicatena]|uniref:2-C-methyl-D-erythritol 4-phosphate cytidylyltransferase n=1 Tax=Sporichthya brevicatena TaxID=171442 RepID=A0ABP3RJP8_9ACTN
MRIAAVVPAAGRGERLGPGGPKALRELSGVPILVHAVRAVAASRSVELVVVAAPPDGVSLVASLLADHDVPAELTVVAGGATRQDSVRRAVASLPPEFTGVLVHDAARPLVPVELVDAVAAALRGGAEAVIPALPVTDTVKQVDDGVVVATPDRAGLVAVQTPQGFSRAVLEKAHAAATDSATTDAAATDDAGLVERIGIAVRTVPGSEEAFKVTRPLDLVFAEAILARRRAERIR